MGDSQSHPETITGGDLAAAIEAAAQGIDGHADAIDALNVFPVPDGDTGTNMALTMRSAAQGARASATSDVGDVAANAARGALMGARGNSGVILAQMLRGLAGSLEGQSTAGAQSLAAALQAGSDAAYAAMTNPVEGTMLTVARAAATEGQAAAQSTRDVAEMFERAHLAARAAVALTPEQLPILKRAGVVDSGAEGYRVLLESMAAWFRGDEIGATATPIDRRADLSALHDENDAYGYCTEVLFQGERIDIDLLRQHVSTLGTSVLVVGDPSLVKIHVHTFHPGQVLEMATERGEILNVKVDNIQRQRDELASALATNRGQISAREPGTSIVAIASGDGFAAIYESLGAVVVSGGSSMNPSVEEILSAVERTPRDDVIVLPNHRNAVLATEEAARLASASLEGRSARVVPTHSMPQGVAGALVLNPDAPVNANVGPVADAIARCRTIAIARAARDATVDAVQVSQGQFLGFLDDRAVSTGKTAEDVLATALDALPAASYEIGTVYWGADGTEDIAAGLAARLTEKLGASAEIARGGQPHYEYIISVE